MTCLDLLVVQYCQKTCIPQQVHICSCGMSGCSPNPHQCEKRSSAVWCTCQRALCSRPSQLECTPINSGCGVVQKHDACWWFGQPGRCGSWNILIATFIVAAGADFLLVLIRVFLGNENSRKSPRMQRCSSQSNSQQASQHAPVCISV